MPIIIKRKGLRMKLKDFKKLEISNLHRSFNVDKSNIDIKNRTVQIALSSEEPYERWFGIEILGHDSANVDLSRLKNGAPLLAEHDTTKQIGIIDEVSLDKDKVLRCIVRFSKNPLAQEYFQDVCDGIRTKVSVGYIVNSMIKISEKYNEETNENLETYLVDSWQPYEGSFVSVPADDSVGVGRNIDKLIKEIQVKELDIDETEENIDEDDIETKKGGYVSVESNSDNSENEDDSDEEEDEDDESEEDKKLKEVKMEEEKDKDMEVKELVVQVFDKVVINSENIDMSKNNNKKEHKKMDNLEIIALGQKYGQADLALEFMSKGKSTAEFTNALLDIKASSASKIDAGTQKELKEFDLNAYLREMVEGEGKMTAMAREFDQDFRGRSKRGGLVLPRAVLQRDYTVGSYPNGGALANNEFRPDLIDALYNNSVVLSVASVYPSATGNASVTYPIVTGKNAFSMITENQRATESNQTSDHVLFTPKTAGGRAVISRDMLKQSGVRPIEAFVTSGLMKSFNEFRDGELLNGSGAAGHVKGIFNIAGTNVVVSGAVSGGLTYKKVVEMESDILYANAGKGKMAYITNSKVSGSLKATQMFANFGGPILTGTEMNGYQVLNSNQIVNATVGQNSLALVNGEHLHYIEWDGYELVVNPFRLGAGQIEYEMFATFDFQVTQPVGITLCTDIVI
jgi:HK97 family phage major capsid protein